jgi:acyl-coenzyme A synthetase/AMP-(fatty) acid ligase
MPSSVAIVHGQARITYEELIDRCRAVAAAWPDLRQKDGKPRVLILLKNPLDILISLLAAWSLDATAAVMRPYGSERIPQLYTNTIAPNLIVTEDDVLVADPESQGADRSRRAAEECLILATSGTTSEPKFVALLASGIDLNLATIARDLGISESDRIQVANPLTYHFGLIGGALPALRQGATIFLYQPPVVPSVLLHDLRENEITLVQGTASSHRLNLQFWNGKPFESVRLFTQGGEFCGPALSSQLARLYPRAKHVECFGMTEGGRICHKVISEPALASNEIGTPFPHSQWKIVPVDAYGAAAAGLLAVKGPSIMLGYLNAAGGYWGLDEDGFFVSSDLVAPAPDGGLRLLGRYDRCFKSGGRLVNPTVVETFLVSQGDVRNAVCSPKPHDILGLIPTVRVVFEHGKRNDVERLKALCVRELEPHMVPREILAVSELPRGSGGKTSLKVDPNSTS